MLDLILGYAAALVQLDPKAKALYKQAESKGIAAEKYSTKDSCLYREKALYLLNDLALRTQVIRMHYDNVLVGYFGKDKIVELVRRKY